MAPQPMMDQQTECSNTWAEMTSGKVRHDQQIPSKYSLQSNTRLLNLLTSAQRPLFFGGRGGSLGDSALLLTSGAAGVSPNHTDACEGSISHLFQTPKTLTST